MQLRLNWTFLVVLGVSVLGTSIAAWAITYASSHSRVVMMAADFTSLAQTTVQDFSGLVTDLLQNSSMIVGSILNLETQAGVQRSAATEQQMTESSLQLLDFARHSTSQSQAQMTEMVFEVGNFITGIIGDFETIAATYAQELRYEFAMKAQSDFQNLVAVRVNAVKRMPTLVQWGFFDGNKPLDAPYDNSDMILLAAMCEYASELGPGGDLTWVTGTGRFYDCIPGTYGRLLSTVIAPDGKSYNQSYVTWYLPTNVTDFKATLQSITPVWTRIGTNCGYPVICVNQFATCGFAAQCRPNVYPYFNLTEPKLLWTSVFNSYNTDKPLIGLTWSMLNTNVTPPELEAVLTCPFLLASVNAFLQTIVSSAGTHLAVMLNDTDLSVMGSVGTSCGPNEVQPGWPLLPLWSVLRSCDPRILAVGTWLMDHRGTALANKTTVTLNDTIWDIFLLTESGLSYYVVVGMEVSAMYGAIWAAESNATQALGNLSASQRSNLLALGNQTYSYMQSLGGKNLIQIQAMQTSLMSELAQLANASQALLNSSQTQSTALISAMLAQQMAKVGDVQTTQLSALAITTAWTIGVVVGLLLAVLAVGAMGTMRLTASLTEIITLMENVAEMKVEQLEVPRDAPVVEVARIQRAFHALVTRLAEYKTYMPAALFNPMEPVSPGKAICRADDTDHDGSVSTDSQLVSHSTGSVIEQRGKGVTRATPSATMTRCNVASLVVNVLRFRDHANDPNIITVFSNYLKLVHRAVSQARGNIDCVFGDQIFATFNAHIPCSDPVTAAATAALEIQASFSKAAGYQFNCLMGLACGPMVAGSAGYTRFRTMVALGKSMKLAFLLSRLSQFDCGAILCDPSVADRIGFTHTLVPVDVVHLPRERPPRGYVVHALTAKKELATDEWLYQVGQGGNDWEATFYKLRSAKTMVETRMALKAYRDEHPGDAWAKRLASRLHAWTPSIGVPLHETADADTDGDAARSEDALVWDSGDTIDPDVPLMLVGHDDRNKGKYRGS